LKLILDEHINPEIGCQLRRMGYDLISVSEAGLRGIGDENLLAYAAGKGRVLVTCNIGDFQLLLHEWRRAGRRHSGILFVSEKTASQRRVAPLVRALKAFFTAAQVEREGIDDQGIFLKRRRE